jgi:hypothetical protein
VTLLHTTLLHVGTAGCWSVCGALAVAAVKAGPRPAAPAGRLHVTGVEEVPATAGDLETPDLTYVYCPAELRVAPHLALVGGGLHCWRCPEGDA